MALEKWNLLLQQIHIVFGMSEHLRTLSKEQLCEFEFHSNIKLPLGYKEFCQVFGSGRFGGSRFRINIPDLKNIEGLLISNSEIIVAYKSGYALRNGCDYDNPDSIPETVKDLLDSFYIFGYGQGRICFAFDLRTYSEIDQSYDIFGFDEDDNFLNLGRDFFEFIRDLCIGIKAEELYPALLAGVPPDNQDSPYGSCNTFFA